MKTHGFFVLLCWAAIAVTASGQSGPAQELLETARKTAVLDGDCAAAIKLFQAIVSRFEKTDRAVSARALLLMADCQEKSGNTQEAQRTYGRVIKDFGDQPAAADARTTTKPRGTADPSDRSRLVWTLPSPTTWVRGNVSADGRYLAIAAPGGGIMLHDVATGAERVVARPTPDDPDVLLMAVAFSRDGRRLVYEVRRGDNETGHGLRVLNLDEPGLPRSRMLINVPAQPCDWSPNGQYIVARLQQSGPMKARRDPISTWQLAIVSVADGEIQVLKTFEARHRSRHGALFSPDGRFVAVEVPENESGARDILVVSVDGRSEVRAVAASGDDGLVGWMPDGSGLLFASTRGSGSTAIWRQPMKDGQAFGQPQLVRDQTSPWTVGITASGSLFYGLGNGPGVSVKDAVFDTATGTFQSALTDIPASFIRSSRGPQWSPDGSQLGYISVRGEQGGNVFVRRDVASGQSRELPLNIFFRNGNANLWFWVPDGQSILTVAEDPDPALGVGLYRTDLTIGRTNRFIPRDPGSVNPRNSFEWSSDGRVFHYSYAVRPGQYVRVAHDTTTGVERQVERPAWPRSADGSKTYTARNQPGSVRVIVERDTATGVERDVLALAGNTDWHLTENGAAIVALTTDLATNQSIAIHHSLATGTRREVFRAQRGQQISITTFAADERSFFVQHKPREGAASLFWWVPVDGRPSRLLTELSAFEDVGWAFHPDGRRVALQVNYPRTMNDQIYVLENFLPATKR